jgi:hypothetical protein
VKKFFIFLFLAGCEQDVSAPDPLHERAKAAKCSSVQLDMVKKDYDICQSSGYFSSHCYDIAKVTYCEQEKKHGPKL